MSDSISELEAKLQQTNREAAELEQQLQLAKQFLLRASADVVDVPTLNNVEEVPGQADQSHDAHASQSSVTFMVGASISDEIRFIATSGIDNATLNGDREDIDTAKSNEGHTSLSSVTFAIDSKGSSTPKGAGVIKHKKQHTLESFLAHANATAREDMHRFVGHLTFDFWPHVLGKSFLPEYTPNIFTDHKIWDLDKYKQQHPDAPNGFDAWFHNVLTKNTKPGEWPLPKGSKKKMEEVGIYTLTFAYIKFIFRSPAFVSRYAWMYLWSRTFTGVLDGTMPYFYGSIAGYVADIYEGNSNPEIDQEKKFVSICILVGVMIILYVCIEWPFRVYAETCYPGTAPVRLMNYACMGRVLGSRPLPEHGVIESIDNCISTCDQKIVYAFFSAYQVIVTTIVLFLTMLLSSVDENWLQLLQHKLLYVVPFSLLAYFVSWHANYLQHLICPSVRFAEEWFGIKEAYAGCLIDEQQRKDDKEEQDKKPFDETMTDYYWICKTVWQFFNVKWASMYFPKQFIACVAWTTEQLVRVGGAFLVWKDGMTFTQYSVILSAMSIMKAGLLPLTNDVFDLCEGYEALHTVSGVMNQTHHFDSFQLDALQVAHMFELREAAGSDFTKKSMKKLKRIDWHGIAQHMTHHEAGVFHKIGVAVHHMHDLAAIAHHADCYDFKKYGIPTAASRSSFGDPHEKVDFEHLTKKAQVFRETSGVCHEVVESPHVSSKTKSKLAKLARRQS